MKSVMRSHIDLGSSTNVGKVTFDKSEPFLNWAMIPMMIDPWLSSNTSWSSTASASWCSFPAAEFDECPHMINKPLFYF